MAFRLLQHTVPYHDGPATELKCNQEVEVLHHMFSPSFFLCLHIFLCAKWRFTDLWEVWTHLFTPGGFKGMWKKESLPWPSAISSCWRQIFHITPFTDSWVMPVEIFGLSSSRIFPTTGSRPGTSISLPGSPALYVSTSAVLLRELFWLCDCCCLWVFPFFYQHHSWWGMHVILQTCLTSLSASLLLRRPLHSCTQPWPVLRNELVLMQAICSMPAERRGWIHFLM